MKNIIILGFVFCSSLINAQFDNSEKFTLMLGTITNGPDDYEFDETVFGFSIQGIYDVVKMHEGAIGIKASAGFGDGFNGYFGGVNARIGARFFLDMDLLFGYKEITNPKLITTYPGLKEYKGNAVLWDLGFGYRFDNSPLVLRGGIGASFATGYAGVSPVFGVQLGYRFK